MAEAVRDPATEPVTEPVARALVRGLRPRQWIKNFLVLAAPLAAGEVTNAEVLVRTALAFVLFCAISSGVYLVNDIRDVDEDRHHPKKRFRPIAAGTLPVGLAWAVAVVLLVGGVVSGFLVAPALGTTFTVYVAIQVAYSAGLKHQPVLDLAGVASGFLLRAIAGGVASGIELSQWFLLVASFGSLFMVAGKRYSEMHNLGPDSPTRLSLQSYSESYLRFVWSLAAATTLVFYGLWAFENRGSPPWAVISLAPFTIGLLRYAVDIDRAVAGSPEDIVLRDRVLQVLAVVWLVLVALFAAGRAT
jgi:decaprenyl-phosphate phosphoribosyltransferase